MLNLDRCKHMGGAASLAKEQRPVGKFSPSRDGSKKIFVKVKGFQQAHKRIQKLDSTLKIFEFPAPNRFVRGSFMSFLSPYRHGWVVPIDTKPIVTGLG